MKNNIKVKKLEDCLDILDKIWQESTDLSEIDENGLYEAISQIRRLRTRLRSMN